MWIYLLRHGIAAPAEAVHGMDDAIRPLTPRGVEKTRAVARGIRNLKLSPQLVLTSPLLRAKQTAELVRDELGIAPGDLRESARLTPGADTRATMRELSQLSQVERVMLVGHQPHLAAMASMLLTGDVEHVALELKKAALCVIKTRTDLTSGVGVLQMLIQPKQLRALG